MISQSLLGGEDSVAVSSPGFPTPVRQQPSPVEKWVPRLLKGPTCQRSRGISHSQPPYCSPGHNRLHGAWPFVISSVVNFCWGNKSVTHLWLWIRPFFLKPSSFFSSFSFLRRCLWQCWPHQKSSLRQKNRLSWSTPRTMAAEIQILFCLFEYYRWLFVVWSSPVIEKVLLFWCSSV